MRPVSALNRDIDNSFPKKRKYWCQGLIFTYCTYILFYEAYQKVHFVKGDPVACRNRIVYKLQITWGTKKVDIFMSF